MNDKEIMYNCRAIVATWLTNHTKDINDKTVFSLKINDWAIDCTKDEIADNLFALIKNGKHGTVTFYINHVKEEYFDIN